ncbi:hypothetical protein E0Z10_g4374 [Xylaria hypoxylon]|uniref:Uncharacterized protein n=1 Tax=Xylaria hypoxylon TaxID=37992 RepID=A0A4Z0YLA6_9PEZI|nr:hypothetical protein E0Z10_g4374 [Xylaria hypoxylon]
MRVVVVELPDDAFNRPAIGSNYFPTISSSISRIQNLKNSQKDVNQICGLLRISVKEANTQYNNQVKDNLKNSKVHAEIQLVYYCQTMLQGKALLPRVICSSKSACWLCNTFILFHGKFHMPRSHGRLYPGWRLPDLQGGWCADMATRFNRHLEGLLTESLKTLYIRKARTKYPEPRESDLSTVKWQSVQSNSSKLSDSVSSEKKSEQISAVVRGISKSSERITTTNQDETLPEEAMSANDAIPENHTSCEDHASASLVSTVVPGTTSSHACAPLGGTPPEPQENTRSYNITLGKVSPVHSLGPLQLQFEYAGGHQKQLQGENPQKQLSCTAEWLSPKEVEQLELEGVVTIDAESLTREEVSHNTDTSHNIYLRLEETVLRVTMRPM